MSTPPCAGRWELFDSTDYRDHLDARAYCVDCPLIVECQKRLEEAYTLRLSGVTEGGPRGTWAGQLIGARINVNTTPRPRPRTSASKLKEAHAAYRRGERTPEVIKGERAYQQAWRDKRRVA